MLKDLQKLKTNADELTTTAEYLHSSVHRCDDLIIRARYGKPKRVEDAEPSAKLELVSFSIKLPETAKKEESKEPQTGCCPACYENIMTEVQLISRIATYNKKKLLKAGDDLGDVKSKLADMANTGTDEDRDEEEDEEEEDEDDEEEKVKSSSDEEWGDTEFLDSNN